MGTSSSTKRKWILRLLAALAAIILLVLAVAAVAIVFIDHLVDIYWYEALGYGLYYWQRLLYRYAVFAAVTLLFFLVFFLNFWVAARFLKTGPPADRTPDTSQEKRQRRRLLSAFQTGTIWFYGPLSLVLAIPIAMPLFGRWETFLFYVFGPDMGVVDPYFGQDVSFYLFSYPIYRLLQRRLLFALLLLTVGLLVLYAAKNRVLKRSLLAFRRGARWHLSLLVLALFGLGVWEFMLQRYDLVYTTRHADLFYGPGYVEMMVILPLIWACIIFLSATAVVSLFIIHRRRFYKTAIVLGLAFLASLALRYTPLLPELVQTYVVKPNEIDREAPNIARHIDATLDAYALKDVAVRNFDYQRFPSEDTPAPVEEVLRNIPVWDAETLVDVFQQRQELRTYYYFPTVNVGRYLIEGSQQQVFLSPREIEFANLPGEAQNWINAHLIYTHGFGAVMTPASQVSAESMIWYLYDIPPRSRYGLAPEQPRIYYGLGAYNYSIAPNLAGEMDYPRGDTNVTNNYDGRGGVPISSLFRKFLFAYYLKNKNVFFSTKITEESKLLFRRNIIDRVDRLIPYLHVDDDPYIAVTRKGIYWILDAATMSRYYPAAAPQQIATNTFNYMRSAVKIVVDAYHGSVDLYITADDDPIIQAYDNIYPGLFKPADQIPEDLRPHLRYPRDYFAIQMQVYAKYHQKNIQVFYQQEDLWTFPQSLGRDNTLPLRPYYVTLGLIEETGSELDFLLLLPMFPKNRDNLRAMAVAGSDPEEYGKLIIYDFPKGELVFGPAQIDALINQDPDIAEQFTLWDQSGSQVVRGNMIILPVGNTILFIQPVYLKATSRVRIPELQRIIMSQGEVVVMEKSVESAYAELVKRLAEEMPEPVPGKETAPGIPTPPLGKAAEEAPPAEALREPGRQPEDAAPEEDRSPAAPTPPPDDAVDEQPRDTAAPPAAPEAMETTPPAAPAPEARQP